MILLGGCTELGEIVVVNFSVEGGTVEFKDLDADFLPKDTLGKSPHCHTRRSVIDNNKWMGVCISPNKKKITIYRAFSNSFDIEKKGITKEVLESGGFKEMSNLSEGVEAILNKREVKYKKDEAQYITFSALNEEFEFTR